MSSSYNCEEHLKELAEELHNMAYELEEAADVLKTLRTVDDSGIREKVKSAKRWAKDWMKG